jgi:hypothetical protein
MEFKGLTNPDHGREGTEEDIDRAHGRRGGVFADRGERQVGTRARVMPIGGGRVKEGSTPGEPGG